MRLAVVAAALALAVPAQASITVAYDAQTPALRVGTDGSAEVSWSAGGTRRTLLVPPTGQVLPGGHLAGADVSKPASSPALPFRKVLRRTTDGRLWALQAWPVRAGGPVELHLARWRGAPTRLSLAATADRLSGRATFQGRAVHGVSPTPEGKQLHITVYLECFGCPGKPGWSRLLGVFPRADGTFSVFLKPGWHGKSNRAILAGPNLGMTLAPDALATT